MNDNRDACADGERLSRIKTMLMMPGSVVEPHDLAWLFRLADEAVASRAANGRRAMNHEVPA